MHISERCSQGGTSLELCSRRLLGDARGNARGVAESGQGNHGGVDALANFIDGGRFRIRTRPGFFFAVYFTCITSQGVVHEYID